MSIFDRWRTNLGVNKSSSSSNAPVVSSKKSKSKQISRTRNDNPDSEDSEDSPSHHSLPSISSSISLKAPLPKPSEESRIVRTGPEPTRRKNLVEAKQASGDQRRDEFSGTRQKYPHTVHQLLDDTRPIPNLHKSRSNNKFFYHGPLSLDQIKNLFWVEEVAPEDHYTQTARALSIFRQKKRQCDVRLTIDRHQCYCHKAVLVTFSQDLQNRLESSSLWKCGKISLDLTSRNLDASTVQSVINWMYTGELSLKNWLDIDKLLGVSEGLKISRLTKMCRKMIPDVVTAAVSSAVEFPHTSRQTPTLPAPVIRSDPAGHNRPEAKTQSAFSKYTGTEDFPQWSFEQVFSLLAKDSISIESEVEVYKAAIRWISHNRSARISYLDRLTSCVRWVYMSAEEMIEAKHADTALFNDPIVSSKAAMGQWQRDLLRRGIQVSLSGLPVNRVEQTQLRKLIINVPNRVSRGLLDKAYKGLFFTGMVNVNNIESSRHFQTAVANSAQYSVIKFYATWCGACKMMAPHYHRIANELPPDQFVFYRVDVDNNKDLAKQHGVEMLPTFVVYKGGQMVYKQSGTVHDKLRRSLVDLMNNRRVSFS